MRKMAYIVRIDKVTRHTNADALDICGIHGWQVVSKLDEFKAGELAVYCEIDSWIPNGVAPFLTKGDRSPREFNGVLGERLRTVRLRGELSQGMLLPMALLPQGEYVEGQDVSELLGIQKWEVFDLNLAGEMAGSWPSEVAKTDEERIQNFYGEKLEALRQGTWEVTEKLEGTSATYFLDEEDTFKICSRNWWLKPTKETPYTFIAKNGLIHEGMERLGLKGLALQGEILGAKICGNIYKHDRFRYFVYNIYDAVNKKYLPAKERYEIVKALENEFVYPVPVIHPAFVIDFEDVTGSLLKMAEGQSVLANVEREGLVFKNIENPGLSFKAISNKYLLKHG